MEINIKTKYDLNEIVYVLCSNKIVIARIIDIQITSNTLEKNNDVLIKYYLVDADDRNYRLGFYKEENMFDTKKQLLESL